MKRSSLRRSAGPRSGKRLRRTTPLVAGPSLLASEAQRAAVSARVCIVCDADRRIDPAHLTPRSLGGCADRFCVVPLCRRCHRAYDQRRLDLLAYLEPGWRAQLAHAVGHVGLLGAVRRISHAHRADAGAARACSSLEQ